MFDYHIHSSLSFDAQDDMEAIVESAKKRGLKEICFTEHLDIDYPYDDINPIVDFKEYFKRIDALKNSVSGIEIRSGVEVGIIPSSAQNIEKSLCEYNFDFVLGSQHVVKGKDPWYPNYFDDKTLKEAQQLYLEELLSGIKAYTDYDVVAHIGYVDKYLEKCKKYENSEIKMFNYEDFSDIIDEILLTVINEHKGIEVNTSNYVIHNCPTPHISIIKRYLALGGEIITVGSDSHNAEFVGNKIFDTYGMLKEIGVEYICGYKNRKPQFHKL